MVVDKANRDAWDRIYGRGKAPPLAQSEDSFFPCGDRIIITPQEVESTRGGILLPPSSRGGREVTYGLGIVEFVGPGRILDNGVRVPVQVKRGMRVIYREYDATEIEINDIRYVMVQETGIAGRYDLLYCAGLHDVSDSELEAADDSLAALDEEFGPGAEAEVNAIVNAATSPSPGEDALRANLESQS